MGKLMNTAKYSAALACVGLMAFIVGLHIENLFSIFIGGIGFAGCTMITIENMTKE